MGIGTGSPSNKLEIANSANDFITLNRTNKTSGTGKFNVNVESNSQTTMSYDSANSLVIGTSTDPATQAGFSEKMRINSSGNVGIGTSAPAHPIHLDVSSTVQPVMLKNRASNYFSGISIYNDQNQASIISQNGGTYSPWGGANTLNIGTVTNNTFNLLQNDTVRMTLHSSGNVGIGTMLPNNKLEVAGDIRVGTSGSNGCLINFGGGLITGTCSSDERLKKDIHFMESVLDKVIQLSPKTWHWNQEKFPEKKFGSQREYGLIAQDLERIFPDMVETDNEGLKRIHYERLPIIAIQSIKELQLLHNKEKDSNNKKLSTLQEANDRLAKENDSLKKRLDRMESALAAIERKTNEKMAKK